MKYVFVKNFAKLRKKNWWFLELVYRLLYDQNSPSFSPSVIKYWKIAVRYDLYLASARFLGFEKCAIDRLCQCWGKVVGVIRHATVLCAWFIGNKNQVATWTLMALQFESNAVYWAWLSNHTDSWSVFGINRLYIPNWKYFQVLNMWAMPLPLYILSSKTGWDWAGR